MDQCVGRPLRAAPFRQPQVLRHGQPGEDAPVLGGVADPAPDQRVRRQRHGLLAVEADAAAARDEAEDAPYGRGLAGPVAAEQGGHAVADDVQADAVQDVAATDQDPQVRHVEQGLLRHSPSPR